MKSSIFRVFFSTFLFSLASATASRATDVILQWDTTTDLSVTGYNVYYNADSSIFPFKGTGSEQGPSPINVGKVTTATLTGLDPRRSYFFTVTAYNSFGMEGPNSNIISVAEAVPPTVSITSPESNATISETVLVTATAGDNVGVTKVEFYLDSILKSTRTSTPYGYLLDTTSLATGTYTLMSRAYDAAGNVGQSSGVAINIVKDTTAPTVSLTSPANNSTLSGTTTITANASDNVGVNMVGFCSNGTLLQITNVAPYSFTWNTTAEVNGNYTLTAMADDAAGNVGQSSAISVRVFNPTVQYSSCTTLWTVATVPIIEDVGPDKAVELGVKFRSDVAGYISGIRFYKATANTGTHVANLWTSTGSHLATATFTNESASGWQQVNFSTPVAIIANTDYIASYHTSTGHYSLDQKYFQNIGVDRPPLHALANGISGSNGVYAYGSSSSFPSQSWNTSNYWVDVVFSTTTTIWSVATVPSVVDVGPDKAVELGVKFRSDVAGYISGIRFYKATANTGTHVANLWTSTGSHLATATFTNESPSGWQQVNFSTPVAIVANTDYIASYHTTTGHYSFNSDYFSNKGMKSTPLHALASGVSGANGVYAYGTTSTFPNQSYMNSNYWVDIAFIPL